MENWRDTVISQYANSATMLRVIESINDWIDPAADFDAFYNLIWNLETAVGYGLDVWGRIVGTPRVLTIPNGQTFFGFADGLSDFAPFGQAPFRNSEELTSNYRLGDEQYRALILVKAASNISSCSASALNKLLQTVFAKRGRCYCNDYGYMQMRYTFEFYLTSLDLAILTQSGAMVRTSGVKVTIVQAPPTTFFGFAEAGPLDCGPFGQQPMLSSTFNVYAAAPAADGSGGAIAGATTAPLDTFVLDSNALA